MQNAPDRPMTVTRLRAVQGPAQTSGPKVIALQQISMARYLERSNRPLVGELPARCDVERLVGRAAHARVALEGTVVHVADIRAIPDYAQPETVAFGLRTLLGVPLLREGAVLGTIGLGGDECSHTPSGNRTGAHLCRPGGDRDGECSAARRIAGPHRRPRRIRSNTRPRPVTCSRSSPARPPTCKR